MLIEARIARQCLGSHPRAAPPGIDTRTMATGPVSWFGGLVGRPTSVMIDHDPAGLAANMTACAADDAVVLSRRDVGLPVAAKPAAKWRGSLSECPPVAVEDVAYLVPAAMDTVTSPPRRAVDGLSPTIASPATELHGR